MVKHLTLTLIFFIYVIIVHGQNVQLVKEINTGIYQNSSPFQFKVSGDKLFFIATDNSGIAKPWVTKGTDATTELLGPASIINNSLSELTPYNNKIYYACDDGTLGRELWVSDGTATGTKLFKDILTGPASSFPEAFGVCNGKLFFMASDKVGIRHLYVSDGTEAGTTLLKEKVVLISSVSGYPTLNNELYFTSDNGTGSGYGLWKTDGTATGTKLLVKDVRASNSPGMYIAHNNKLYLNVGDNINGTELWISDGTAAGTKILKNLSADGVGIYGNGDPQGMIIYKDKMYFAGRDDINGMELFVTDGTEAGTKLIKDIWPGKDGGLPYNKVVYNGFLYFEGFSNQLWKTDGTTAGTVMVKDLLAQITFPAVWNNKLYIRLATSSILYESDGTAAGTKPAVAQNIDGDINTSGSDKYFTEYKSELYFSGNIPSLAKGNEPFKLTLGALPLNLLSFTGQRQQNDDVLKWSTSNEVNTSHFNIEQSVDGVSFSQVSTVKASGARSGTSVYNFTQSSSLNTGGYYRLQMVDKDAAFTYSNVIRLKRDNAGVLRAFYNNESKEIMVFNGTRDNYTCKLINMNGGVVKHTDAAIGTSSISAAGLASGTYILVCTSPSSIEKIKLFIR